MQSVLHWMEARSFENLHRRHKGYPIGKTSPSCLGTNRNWQFEETTVVSLLEYDGRAGRREVRGRRERRPTVVEVPVSN